MPPNKHLRVCSLLLLTFVPASLCGSKYSQPQAYLVGMFQHLGGAKNPVRRLSPRPLHRKDIGSKTGSSSTFVGLVPKFHPLALPGHYNQKAKMKFLNEISQVKCYVGVGHEQEEVACIKVGGYFGETALLHDLPTKVRSRPFYSTELVVNGDCAVVLLRRLLQCTRTGLALLVHADGNTSEDQT